MAYPRLNRAGKVSNRNLAKPFKLQRIIIDKKTGESKIHPLDRLPLGEHGRLVNSTGCFGDRNFGQPPISIVKKTPGKTKYSRPKKNVCKLFCGNANAAFNRMSFKQLSNLRDTILTARLMGMHQNTNVISRNIIDIAYKITDYIVARFPERAREMFDRDKRRESSMKGMTRGSRINVDRVRSLHQRIKRAMKNMHNMDGP